MKLLRDHKSIAHPFLGISYQSLTDDVRNELHIPIKNGVIVINVLADGPAAKAGVQTRDVISAIDGKELNDNNSLSDYINSKDVGDTIAMNVQRWDESSQTWAQVTLKVKLENKPANVNQQQTQPSTTEPNNGGNGLPAPPY
jgi:S1-C subfamily serine protease